MSGAYQATVNRVQGGMSLMLKQWMRMIRIRVSCQGMDEHEAEFFMRAAWNYQQAIKLLEQRS
jgi:hypothetical protein